MTELTAELENLLVAIARRDRSAFSRLYDAASSKLFGIILRICRDRSLAEDVLQEAFIRIWRSADRYDVTSGRAITWMAAIARNAAIDAIRQRRVREARFSDADDDQIAGIADENALAVHPGDREALRTCLGRLDEEQRKCVMMAYQEGLSREELAEHFARPVGTIKTWLHRALARLKECLESE